MQGKICQDFMIQFR